MCGNAKAGREGGGGASEFAEVLGNEIDFFNVADATDAFATTGVRRRRRRRCGCGCVVVVVTNIMSSAPLVVIVRSSASAVCELHFIPFAITLSRSCRRLSIIYAFDNMNEVLKFNYYEMNFDDAIYDRILQATAQFNHVPCCFGF